MLNLSPALIVSPFVPVMIRDASLVCAGNGHRAGPGAGCLRVEGIGLEEIEVGQLADRPLFPHPRQLVGRMEDRGDVRSQTLHHRRRDDHGALAGRHGFLHQALPGLVEGLDRGRIGTEHAHDVRRVLIRELRAARVDLLRHGGGGGFPVVFAQLFFGAFQFDCALVVIPFEGDLQPLIEVDHGA